VTTSAKWSAHHLTVLLDLHRSGHTYKTIGSAYGISTRRVGSLLRLARELEGRRARYLRAEGFLVK
jgi:hypothetical protein